MTASRASEHRFGMGMGIKHAGNGGLGACRQWQTGPSRQGHKSVCQYWAQLMDLQAGHQKLHPSPLHRFHFHPPNIFLPSHSISPTTEVNSTSNELTCNRKAYSI